MTHGFRARVIELSKDRPLQVLTLAALAATTVAVAAPASPRAAAERALAQAVQSVAVPLTATPVANEPAWVGADVDGDGAADFANPTGNAPRIYDAYGSGEFGASRDGGARRHEGVDFEAKAGQTVVAPISGYVTRIGYAYASDRNLKYVEISNPALRLEARAFYIEAEVAVGDTVQVGEPIGRVRSLQDKYPGGMTDHVHLELIDRSGRRFDATDVITAD